MGKSNPGGDAETQSQGRCGNPIPGEMRKHHPRGCCGNPGICLIHARGPKSLKGSPRATHFTDRAQTSGNVTPTAELCPPHPTFRTKVRARRDVSEKKKTIILIHGSSRFVFSAQQVLNYVTQSAIVVLSIEVHLLSPLEPPNPSLY